MYAEISGIIELEAAVILPRVIIARNQRAALEHVIGAVLLKQRAPLRVTRGKLLCARQCTGHIGQRIIIHPQHPVGLRNIQEAHPRRHCATRQVAQPRHIADDETTATVPERVGCDRAALRKSCLTVLQRRQIGFGRDLAFLLRRVGGLGRRFIRRRLCRRNVRLLADRAGLSAHKRQRARRGRENTHAGRCRKQQQRKRLYNIADNDSRKTFFQHRHVPLTA